MSTEVLFALIFIFVLSTLAILLWNWRSSNGRPGGDSENPDGNPDFIPKGSDCPLCGEHLPRGTRVHSTIFPGKEFDLMRIYGCRHCWSGHSAAPPPHALLTRRCPYCSGEIPENGYVMAQVYRKPYRKTHVHVYGCTVCSPGRG